MELITILNRCLAISPPADHYLVGADPTETT
jgi:hypothetical protein